MGLGTKCFPIYGTFFCRRRKRVRVEMMIDWAEPFLIEVQGMTGEELNLYIVEKVKYLFLCILLAIVLYKYVCIVVLKRGGGRNRAIGGDRRSSSGRR